MNAHRFPHPDDPDLESQFEVIEQYPDHPLAGIFPMMPEADLEALAADIEIHGQRAPITLLDGQILDGRNRYRACLLAGIEPRFREFGGDDPLQFVLSANLHRRHLSESQRAAVAAKIAKLPRGRQPVLNVPIGTFDEQPSGSTPEGESPESAAYASPTAITTEMAAARLNVSVRSVRRAKIVLQDPELLKAVECGEMSLAAAVKEIKAAAARKNSQSGDANTEPGIIRDNTGYPIPEHLIPLWNRAGEILQIQRAIARAKHLVKVARAHQGEDRLWVGVSLQSIGDHLHSTQRDLDGAIPYAVCATCQGHSRDQCLHCKGKGFLSEHLFERTVPEELKAIRARSCVVIP